MVANIRVRVVDPEDKPVPNCKVHAINYSAIDNSKIDHDSTTDEKGEAIFKMMDTGIFGGDRYSIYAIVDDKKTRKTLFGWYSYLALSNNIDVPIKCVYIWDKNTDIFEVETTLEKAKIENSKKNEEIKIFKKDMDNKFETIFKKLQDLRQRAKTNGMSSEDLNKFDEIDDVIQDFKDKYRDIVR